MGHIALWIALNIAKKSSNQLYHFLAKKNLFEAANSSENRFTCHVFEFSEKAIREWRIHVWLMYVWYKQMLTKLGYILMVNVTPYNHSIYGIRIRHGIGMFHFTNLQEADLGTVPTNHHKPVWGHYDVFSTTSTGWRCFQLVMGGYPI